jgi:hypothetical protein
MAAGFIDDPKVPGRRVWRRSNGRAVASGAAAVLIGLMSLALFGVAGFVVRTPSEATLCLAMVALAAFMAALTAYVWRDMRGKLGCVILLDAAGVTLRLPAGRSLIHNPPACREVVPWSDVAAVETRQEAYASLLGAIMQRAYRLTRKTAPAIFLFEERALGTRLADPTLRPIAEELAARAGVALDDLGMAQGRGGILGVWFTAAPGWTQAPLPAARQAALWRRASLTGLFAGLALMAFLFSLAFR